MDYLEGAFLGKLWSDTDFENRKHRGVALALCAVFWLYAFFMVYQINFTETPKTLTLFFIWFILAAALLLLSPLLSYYYYNLPLPVRWGVLLVQAAKYVFCYLFLYTLFVPLLRFDKDKVIADFLNFANKLLGGVFESGVAVQSMSGLMWNAILIAIVSLLVFVLFFVLLALLPMLYMKLLRFIQFSIDQAFIRLLHAVRTGQEKGRAQGQSKIQTGSQAKQSMEKK